MREREGRREREHGKSACTIFNIVKEQKINKQSNKQAYMPSK